MKIEVVNLGRGYASLWCCLVHPGSTLDNQGAPRLLLLYLRAGLRWGASSILCTLPHPANSHVFNFLAKPLALGQQLACREVAQHFCLKQGTFCRDCQHLLRG